MFGRITLATYPASKTAQIKRRQWVKGFPDTPAVPTKQFRTRFKVTPFITLLKRSWCRPPNIIISWGLLSSQFTTFNIGCDWELFGLCDTLYQLGLEESRRTQIQVQMVFFQQLLKYMYSSPVCSHLSAPPDQCTVVASIHKTCLQDQRLGF